MRRSKKMPIIFASVIILVTLTLSALNVGASSKAGNLTSAPFVAHTSTKPSFGGTECFPGSGWKWSNGPEQPDVAELVRQELGNNGIIATVKATSYGELDSCDSFFIQGVDFSITMADPQITSKTLPQNLSQEIYPILAYHARPRIGNVKIQTQQGEIFTLDFSKDLNGINQLESQAESTGWQQVITANSPQGRYTHGMAYDINRNLVILFGGDSTGSSRLNDTWTYDGTNWTQVLPIISPPGRVNIDQTLIYDSLRSRVILFGGLTNSYQNDTWEFNGNNWAKVNIVNPPPARDAHAMVFNSFLGQTILFGGYGSSSLLNDTWKYNGSWSQLNPTESPSARFHHAMAYDSTRHVIILFGGSNNSSRLSDTWEYNGTTWQQVFPVQSPSARENHAMAYDSIRGVVVLYGGWGDGGRLGDTWEYDGTTWKQVATSQAPSARTETSLVYNSQSGKVVLFGGGGSSSFLNDTWEYIGGSIVPPVDPVTKKVYVIDYDPILSNGQKLSEYYHWNNHTDLTQGTIDFFKQASHGKINYTVVDTTVVNGWPEKIDGYIFTEAEYLAAMSGTSPWHQPDGVDYNKIVNSTQFDICGKVNRGEVDEVWIYNGPGFGFYESTLAGPGGYWFNSPPVSGPNTCNKPVPIMGPSPERGLDCATENFGHRTESTMVQVYESWQQNRTDNNWERFGLVKYLSPNYSYSGCGNIHYPPNGISDYDYGNPSTVLSNCNDFDNYPNLSDPLVVAQPVTCTLWGCDHLEYFRYWFSHFPHNTGCGPDMVSNNWWNYFASPALALNPLNACTSSMKNVFLPLVTRY